MTLLFASSGARSKASMSRYPRHRYCMIRSPNSGATQLAWARRGVVVSEDGRSTKRDFKEILPWRGHFCPRWSVAPAAATGVDLASEGQGQATGASRRLGRLLGVMPMCDPLRGRG